MNDFFQLEDFIAGGLYSRYWDEASKVPWLYSPTEHGGHFITYDDAESTQHKVDYVEANGLVESCSGKSPVTGTRPCLT